MNAISRRVSVVEREAAAFHAIVSEEVVLTPEQRYKRMLNQGTLILSDQNVAVRRTPEEAYAIMIGT